MFLLSLRCKGGLLHEHVPAFMDMRERLLACDKLFSVLVSRQDLFYLNNINNNIKRSCKQQQPTNKYIARTVIVINN